MKNMKRDLQQLGSQSDHSEIALHLPVHLISVSCPLRRMAGESPAPGKVYPSSFLMTTFNQFRQIKCVYTIYHLLVSCFWGYISANHQLIPECLLMCLSLCYAGGREIRHKILMSRSMPSNLVGNTKITISIGWNCWRTPNDMAWYVAPSRVPSLSWVLTMSQVSHPLHPWRLSPMWYFISTFIHRWGNRDLESLTCPMVTEDPNPCQSASQTRGPVDVLYCPPVQPRLTAF